MKKSNMKIIIIIFSLLWTFILAKEKIAVFHAGSLSVPFLAMEKAFEDKYPQYDVLRESAGSRASARKITDVGKPADIMASADYKVIDNLLIPKYAKLNIQFATNEMAIAYTKHSKYANEINEKNWTDIFLRKGVKVAHSNPNLDPCGYRSMLVTQLAEIYYKQDDFYNKLLGYGDSYTNGEEKKAKVIVRPKETDLLGLLEIGAYDYLYIYKSVAKQHNLKYITLPPEVSLVNERYSKFYKNATFNITGKKPNTFVTKKGSAMVYGITIVQNKKNKLPRNKDGAIKFINFVISSMGQKIMQENGQGVINPPIITGNKDILK
jgi:molybdate/tungstate transport system substrate-binding protein